MSPWLFNVSMDIVKEVKMGMGRRRVRFLEEGREWRLPGLIHFEVFRRGQRRMDRVQNA